MDFQKFFTENESKAKKIQHAINEVLKNGGYDSCINDNGIIEYANKDEYESQEELYNCIATDERVNNIYNS